MDYTGKEEAIDLKVSQTIESDVIFDLRPPNVPSRATPIHDETLGAIVGYRYQATTGVYKLYDLEGKLVGMEEEGLESPLFDPLDLIFFVGGIFRSLAKGTITGASRASAKVAATGAARLTTRSLAAFVVGAMRTAFRQLLSARSLKFTATTAAHMSTKGRYVPVHILHLAIKHGKRTVDPQKVEGAFLYSIKMLKNGKEYLLEVVVREKDWTILHFLYK